MTENLLSNTFTSLAALILVSVCIHEDREEHLHLAANGTTTNFKIQPNLIAILPTFRGRANEETYTHLCEFFSIADTHEVTSMTKDGVRLRLFPFSLKDQAKEWFSSLEPGSINSWAKLQYEFIDEFYSISKIADVRSRIKSFRQLPGEQFHEAFNGLKELLRTCPHHDVPKWELVKVFYDGLDSNNQQFVVATSGVFFSRPMEEECDFFEKLSKDSRTQGSVDRTNNQSSSINFVSNPNDFHKEMKSKIGELNKKFDLLLRNIRKGSSNVSQVSQVQEAYSMCGDPSHLADRCQSWGSPPPSEEHVNGA
ncbi:DNA-directed DNA polymerase [Tanacetum coccineum]